MYKIYIAEIGSFSDETYALFLSVLPVETKAKIVNLKSRNKQLEKVLGNMLIRYAVKDFFGIPMKNQNFSADFNGKPHIVGYENVYFNLSHSSGVVACAVSDDKIGIDIEKIRPISENVINRVCSKKEKNLIDSSHEKSSEFIRIWTAKEAAAKLVGEGLKGNLRLVNSSDAESIKYKNEFWISVCK